ncbi:MAG: hypothetical protein A2Z99_03705 [Treponema sp. GWB1_62_6]|nr:MAG: hypothetical protein A2Z99_03705 [Treponema sp. GWB1_62_6]OHE65727.1 MAG: hypothetical protein A2001_15030 [Treponema sp. GWC1_61_84]OHE73314.1 MAG: hypothetical protein A2413_17980 [Treponema sp. RIFOXYC1_FULL_61_9]
MKTTIRATGGHPKLGLPYDSLLIIPYDPEWPLLYVREAAALERRMAGYKVRMEHIGSTSVPDLPSKPIIDIVVAATPFDPIENIIELLSGAGYSCLGECGRPDRFFSSKSAERTPPITSMS